MIVGNSIILRHVQEIDRAAYHEWINDRELMLFNSAYQPVSDSSHEHWFNGISKIKNMAMFSIVEKKSNLLIGTCSLRSINHQHRNAELQIRIGVAKARGVGYGVEAVNLLLDHAFLDLNLQRVFLNVFEGNEVAIAAYKKCGFEMEGCQRRAVFIDGKYLDVYMMSVLATYNE